MLRRHDFLAVRKEPLTLPCEWRDCQTVFTLMRDFTVHILEHLRVEKFVTETTSTGQPLPVVCQWRDCGHDFLCELTQLLRHVYFHAFHVKIKSVGMSLLCRSGLTGCQLDRASRNVIPQLPDKLQCGWCFCDMRFDDAVEFYSHVKNHVDCYPDGNRVTDGCKCNWEGCLVVVQSKHKLRDHMRSHTQEKVIACPTCGSLFSCTTKFMDHMKRQMDVRVQNYECSHCSKRFATERLLRDHIRHHVNHYKCPFCDMTCQTPSGLRTHIRYRHTTDKPFKCTQCDYQCKTEMLLTRHMETHSDHWYRCGVANCVFRCHSVTNMNFHHRHAHEEPIGSKYLCHLCTMRFPRGTRLTKHLKTYHNFKWPSGHSRFRYKPHPDGFYRLETVRYESLELTEQMMGDDEQATPSTTPDPEVTPDSNTLDGDTYNLEMLGDVASQQPEGMSGSEDGERNSGQGSEDGERNSRQGSEQDVDMFDFLD